MTRMRALALLSVTAVLVTACGGSSSSKPSYCSAVSSLGSSIKAIPTTSVVKNGTSALQSALSKVQSDATTVVKSAKSDFPGQTSALSRSINALVTTVKQIESSPSPATIAHLPGDVVALNSAAQNFANATKSKCG